MGRCNGEERWKADVRVLVDPTISENRQFDHMARGYKRIFVHLATNDFLQSVRIPRNNSMGRVFVQDGQGEDSRQFRLVASRCVVNKGRSQSLPAGGGGTILDRRVHDT